MDEIRTDLASEAAACCQTCPEGVAQREFSLPGCQVTELEILTPQAAKEVGKPQGRYFTVELSCLRGHESNRLQLGAEGVAHCLELLLTDLLPGPVLVAGLGNRTITPDAIGPWAVESVLVTRHLREELPETFLPVSAVAAGVLGTTGVETGELIQGVADRVKPRLVIAIDALAARSVERLCTTVQLTDTGIVPGSGVGNARRALNQETLGVPVIALGVPTVVDGGTLAADLTGHRLERNDPAHRLIVTPRDIDQKAMETAKLVGMAINLALHGLSYEEAQGLVG